MGRFVKGSAIVIPFPYSDLSAAKRRPALVVADLDGDDVILCQITSRAVSDSYALPITRSEFASGGLRVDSTRGQTDSSQRIPTSLFTKPRP
jgi:mRNA interferase MazF